MSHLIPVFRLEFDAEFRRRFHELSELIFDEAYLSDHTFVRRFEEKFAQFQQSKFALATTNGTTALELVMRSLDIRGKKVVLPTNTFIASAIAILNAGGIPLPLDIEEGGMCLDPALLRNTLDRRDDIAAVLAVHIAGLISPGILDISDICRERNLPLIEDCAHCHGAELRGKSAGTFGLAGCFSFFTTKTMTTGEGGMVVTDDEVLKNKLLSCRRFGMDPDKIVIHVRDGNNGKMGEFQGLLGVLELERCQGRINRRRAIAGIYRKRLEHTGWRLLQSDPLEEGTYYKQVVLPPVPRSSVEGFFSQRGIALTGGVYYHPLHRQPVLSCYTRGLTFPRADRFADTHICPPCYPELSDAEVEYICTAMIELEKQCS